MLKYPKLPFSILLFFILVFSLNRDVYSSRITHEYEYDGASNPIHVKTYKIKYSYYSIPKWIDFIKEHEGIADENESKAQGILAIFSIT